MTRQNSVATGPDRHAPDGRHGRRAVSREVLPFASRQGWLSILALAGLLAGVASAGADTLAVRAVEAPLIDGVIEPLWETGRLFDQFVQIRPDIVREPPVRTETWLLYDSHHVYLAARMHQPRATVRGTQGRRDADVVLEGDTIAFLLDPLVNGNFAYVFAVNPVNGIADGRLVDGSDLDTSWDGVFTTATRIEDDGWTVEIRIPVTSLSFQNREEQDWGVLVERIFAEEQRVYLNRLASEDRPYQIARFHRVTGLRGVGDGSRMWTVVPYAFGSRAEPRAGGDGVTESKAGVDLRVRPVPSLTVLLTANPDYAQIESDREVINVSDVPESYPEKRPFFTESSDLYPGLAVNTRNIQDIRVGLKLRQVLPRLKYDATFVEDGEGASWLLGDLRFTDNETFHAELIGGLRDAEEGSDYNVTTNVRRWWLDRRLVLSSWFGTINGPEGGSNEWETVHTLRWQSRQLDLALRTHFKSGLYNPGIIGHNTLSNEVSVAGWAEYSLFRDQGRLRRLTPRIEVWSYDLYEGGGGAYLTADASLRSVFRVGEAIGDTELTLRYGAPLEQKFRYRTVDGYDPGLVHRDAFGEFVLERQRRARREITLRSDFSKPFGVALGWEESAVRGSPSRELSLEAYWKIGSKALVSGTWDSIRLSGSQFQDPYREDVQRLKVEYNPTDRFNLRGVFDLNRSRQPVSDITEIRTPTANLTVSWEYRPGSFVYFVLNEWRRRIDSTLPGGDDDTQGERSVALKVSRDFTFQR